MPKVIQSSLLSHNIRYAIRDVVVLANQLKAQGRELLSLNIGDPNKFDFTLCETAQRAIVEAVTHGECGYAPSLGLPSAVDAIIRDANRKGVRNVIGAFTANGASEAIDICLTALLNPGDNVLIPSPTYPLYTAVIGKLACEARTYILDEKAAWQPNIETLAALIDERTRAIVVINPNNPTGMLYDRHSLEAIIDLAKTHNLLILNDEIYDEILLDEGVSCTHLASLDSEVNVVTFNGLSKNFMGPGIRMGWGVLSGPDLEDFYEGVQRILRARLCASRPVQHAIAPCLDGEREHLPPIIDRLRARRDAAMSRIVETPGLHCVTPKAAFYGFVRMDGVVDDAAWCRQLMIDTGVVVVPGSGFDYRDPRGKDGYFRFVFLPPLATVERAFDLIRDFSGRYR